MTAIITAIISAAVGVISLCYSMSKDTYAYLQKKVRYSNILDKNCEALYCGIDFLLRLRTDIERMIQRRGISSPPICKNWNERVWKIDGEARTLFRKYKDTKQSNWFMARAKLSRKMIKLLEKANELKNDGKELANLLSHHNRSNKQEIRR